MALEIIRLLQNECLRGSIGAAGARRMARDFAFKDYASDLMALALGNRTVSVIVPNYNYARFLRQRMDSIWSQTFPIHEVILLDDASTDDSEAVIAELERDAKGRLRVIRNDINSGAAVRQWARGIELATGDLAWIAEVDDFADPEFLATVARAFDNPHVVLAYTQSRQIDEDGRILAEDYLDYVADIDASLWKSDYSRPGIVEIAEALSVKNTIPNVSAVLFRRADLARVLQEHGEALYSYKNAGDWYCYLHLLTSGSVTFIAASLNNHRRHSNSVTIDTGNNQRHLREIAALQGHAAELAQVPHHRAVAARAWYDEVARMFGLTQESALGSAVRA
jgi:glycosyltransferase involved in cell wall biosynthesis